MSDVLTRAVADRLKRPFHEVERALAAFSGALLDQLKTEGRANVAGLGFLVAAEDGIRFEPRPEFESVVNFRWPEPGSGLPGIPDGSLPPSAAEVSGAAESPPAKSPAPSPDEELVDELAREVIAPDEPEKTDRPAPPPWRTLAGAPDAPPPASTPTPKPTPAPPPAPPPTAAAAPPPPPAGPPPDPYAPGSDSPAVRRPTAPPAEFGPGAVATGVAAKARSRSPRTPAKAAGGASRAAGSWMWWAAAGVVVVLLAAYLWTRFTPKEPALATLPAAMADSVGVAADSAAAAGPAVDSTAAFPSETPTAPAGSAPAPRIQPPAAQPAGGPFDINSSGYTLVIGSSTSEQGARSTAARYTGLGLPVAVLAYPDDGATRYRIAVGRFSTSAVADSVRRSRQLDLPAGTWVRRIRP